MMKELKGIVQYNGSDDNENTYLLLISESMAQTPHLDCLSSHSGFYTYSTTVPPFLPL